MPRKLKKMRGGGTLRNSRSSVNESNSLLTILLIGVLLFLVYHLTNLQQPQVIIKESPPNKENQLLKEPTVIIKEIIKEEDNEPYREDIYRPDIRRRIRTPPFNYPTRGPPEKYDMVGFLQDSEDPNKLQQLYGRRTYPNSNNWNYYVKSDQYHQIPIPVTIDGKNCTDETGCKELQNKDNINVFNKQQTATIYKPEPYYYNPTRL
tara:strand:- start:135 stop:752 length:618 start_codon:yes stop_codon:yes gene_type:complete